MEVLESAVPAAALEVCAVCGAKAATRSKRTQQFAYREGGNEVELIAQIPVLSCASCGETYTADGAEEAQHSAVCRYLGRLSPEEIKDLRRRNRLTQQKLAELTGIGIASIKRWENGLVIQNASLDARLRSVDQRRDEAARSRPTPRFRTTFSRETLEAAPHFALRPRVLEFA